MKIANVLATKEDTFLLKENIHSLKEDILKFQIDVEKRFNNIILWIVATGMGVVGLIFSIIKYS